MDLLSLPQSNIWPSRYRLRTEVLAVALALSAMAAAAPAADAGLLAPRSACPGQHNASARASAQERAMRCLHNFARREAGRPGLRAVRPLARSSNRKSGDILRCDEFSHTACGRDFTYWIRRTGYGRCFSAGENIAAWSGPGGSPRAIMRLWLNSTGHRRNIISSSFSDIGVGLRIGNLDGVPGTHVWTTHFGDRC
jgi:uncharacterized protein YkwD